MSILALAGMAAAAFAPQANAGADLLAKHAAALSSAKSLTVTFTVKHFPAASEEYKLVLGRPELLRIEAPNKTIVTDGKKIWEYTKEGNEYVELPGDMKTLLGHLQQDEYMAWAAFFIKDQFKGVSDAKLGATRPIGDRVVQEVKFTLDALRSKTAILYFDPATGVAKGISVKAARSGDSNETLVLAKDIKIGTDDADASLFVFTPPAGAKKVEVAAGDLEKWYYNLAEGIKVAKATNRMVFLDIGTEW